MKKGLSITVDFVHEDMNTDDLVVIPFEENDMTWEIGMLTLKDRAFENSVEKFSEYIIEYLK